MANSNEHIEEFLNYYLEKETSPDYAVLITGCWGSGKTYFIKQYLAGKNPDGQKKDVAQIREWLTDCEKYTVVYTSLFGAKSREDMDARVLEKLRPVINPKDKNCTSEALSLIASLAGIAVGVAVATSVTLPSGGSAVPYAVPAGVAAGNSIGIFLKNFWKEHLKKKDIKKKESLFKNDYLSSIRINEKESKRLVVIFDDVERADMPLPELLGYLNAYVEHLHVPCILLADQDRWAEAQKSEDDKLTVRNLAKTNGENIEIKLSLNQGTTLQNLSSTQEKVVGKVLQIRTSIDDIVNAWLAPEKGCLDVSTDIKDLWWQNKEHIYELFNCIDAAKIKYSGKDEWGRTMNEKPQQKYDKEQMFEYVSKIPLRNFRALKHTIKDFDNLCSYYCPELGELLKSETAKKRGATGIFIRHFLKMRYCLTIGMYDAASMWNRSVVYSVRDDLAEENSMTKWDCFEDVMYKADFLDGFPMQDWLIYSGFDKASAINKIKSSTLFGGHNEFMIHQVYHWWILSDEEAEESFKIMNKALGDGSIRDPNTLVYLFVVMSDLAKENFTTFDMTYVKELFNKYLDEYPDKIKGEEVDDLDTIQMNYESVKEYKDEFITFRNRLLKILANSNEVQKQEKQKEFFENLLSEDGEKYNKAYSLINHISTRKKFSWIHVDEKIFIEKFRKLNRYRRNEIFTALKYRYLNIPDECDLKTEKNYLTSLKIECQRIINEKRDIPLPSLFSLNHLMNTIDGCLQKIEAKVQKENKDGVA